MRNYTILAILSVCLFSSALLFLQIKGKKHPTEKDKRTKKVSFNSNYNNKNEFSSNGHRDYNDSEVIKVSFDDSIFSKNSKNYDLDDDNDNHYGSFERSASDYAHAHRMEEKYFMNISGRQHNEMHRTLKAKLESISRAGMKREKTKKGL